MNIVKTKRKSPNYITHSAFTAKKVFVSFSTRVFDEIKDFNYLLDFVCRTVDVTGNQFLPTERESIVDDESDNRFFSSSKLVSLARFGKIELLVFYSKLVDAELEVHFS